MKQKKTERFEMLLTPRAKSALTKLALKDDCSRAEWIDKAIRRSAMRRRLWDGED